MTDNNDHWANPYGSQQPGQQAWGYPDAGQQVWGQPQTGAQPVEYPGYAQQPGYQPTQQYYPGQADPNYYGQQPFPGQQPPFPGQQPGFPGQQPPPPGGPNRTWLILGAVAAVVVLVGGGLAAYVLTRDDSTTTAAPSTSSSAVPTGKPSTSKGPSGAPKAGATTVVAPSLGISYDVPSGWTIAAPTETSMQTGADGTLFGYAKSSEGQNYCPGSAYRALAFVAPVDGVSDLGAAATKATKISVESGYDDAKGGIPGAPTAVTTKSGIAGQQVEASGPWKPSLSGCTANAYSVYTFAFTGPRNATLALVVEADRGTTGEMAADQAKALIASIRTS
ncbi:hypothetical protein [Nocardia sp. NPDC004722]